MQRTMISKAIPKRLPPLSYRQLGARRWQSSSSSSGNGGSLLFKYVGYGLGFSTGLGCFAYAYYHFSGLKAMVDRVMHVKAKVDTVKTAYRDHKPKTFSEAVTFLRSISKSHQGPVPDAFVDAVAQYQGAHDQDIDNIIFGACDDVRAVLAHANGVTVSEDGVVLEAKLPQEDRARIVDAVRRRAGELRRLARERRQARGAFEDEEAEGDGKQTGLLAKMRARRVAKEEEKLRRAEEDEE